MYGVEALDLKNSLLHSLDNPLHLVFGMIFKSCDKNILNSCLFYMNTLFYMNASQFRIFDP